jgi:glycosyltransferase involved in cell wall biosynthesis
MSAAPPNPSSSSLSPSGRLGRVDALARALQPAKTCLFILPWSLRFVGGVNEVVRSLIRGLEAEGEITPLVLVSSITSRVPEYDSRQSYGTVYLDLPGPVNKEGNLRGYLAFVLKLPARILKIRKLVEEYNIEIVNLHFPNLCALYFVVMRRFGLYRGGVILSFHGTDGLLTSHSKGLERWLWKLTLRSVDQAICPSQELARELRSMNVIEASKLAVINNGVNVELFSSRPEELHQFPQELVGRPVVVSIGSFVESKGHQTLLRAFPKVLERIPQAAIVLVGARFDYGDELRRLSGELGIEACTYLFENVPQETIPAFLSRAKVFALATWSEGFPLALLEAGAARLPVISTWSPGVPELITHQVTGRLLPIGDVDAFAQTMIELLENPDEAKRLAENLYNHICENLTWGHHFASYRQFYESAMSREASKVS